MCEGRRRWHVLSARIAASVWASPGQVTQVASKTRRSGFRLRGADATSVARPACEIPPRCIDDQISLLFATVASSPMGKAVLLVWLDRIQRKELQRHIATSFAEFE